MILGNTHQTKDFMSRPWAVERQMCEWGAQGKWVGEVRWGGPRRRRQQTSAQAEGQGERRVPVWGWVGTWSQDIREVGLQGIQNLQARG